MKYIAILNSEDALVLIPETEKEKEVIAFFRNMGDCTVSAIEQNSSVLDITTSGSLLIKKKSKNAKNIAENSTEVK